MDNDPQIASSSPSGFAVNDDSTMDAVVVAQSTSFEQRQMNQAIAASLESVDLDSVNHQKMALETDLREAKHLHDTDLYKTQDNFQDGCTNDANVLILVMFPDSRSTTSCRSTTFNTGRILLTYEQVLSTGSELLADHLVNERHQRRAKLAAAPLPEGIDYVLDLSPTTDENDYTIALQLLSITYSVQLWHRAVALGTSPLAVAGHDDVCLCLLPFNEPYPLPTPPDSMKSKSGSLCILDTIEWPLEKHRKIDDFCTTRWAANTLRLFRAISKPPGQKDLLIDSAPRMWTLVGLFAKLEMTNYNILRDEVVAWFNSDMNHAFVELCPEETLHVGLILKTPLLTEPAFRILVNERALEVAGGQPRLQPATTLFGRRCSEFSGTDVAESISRMIEHASNAMADRYKIALDDLSSDNALDLLDIPQWKELQALEDKIPKGAKYGPTRLIRVQYDLMMSKIRRMFRDAVEEVIWRGGQDQPTAFSNSNYGNRFGCNGLTVEEIEEIEGQRAFFIPKRELVTTRSFASVYTSLNRHQRALTPFVWRDLITMAENLSVFVDREVDTTVNQFQVTFEKLRRDGKLFGPRVPGAYGVLSQDGFCNLLWRGIMAKLKAYVKTLVTRDEDAFLYSMTPHLLLVSNDHEMNFLRLADDESTFQTEAPETDLGPSGPGPAFHTGHTIPSVSDLDFEKLAVDSDDGASTVVGSMAVQDGISTVFNRRRVLARSEAPSVASEQFTDGGMSGAYADAENDNEVPADRQSRGQTPSHIIEQADDGYDSEELDVEELDLDLDSNEDSESGALLGDDDVEDIGPGPTDHTVADLNVDTEAGRSGPPVRDTEREALWSEGSDDSDFEVITKTESH